MAAERALKSAEMGGRRKGVATASRDTTAWVKGGEAGMEMRRENRGGAVGTGGEGGSEGKFCYGAAALRP